MDEPFARQSAYVRWEIANLTTRHHRKVLLNGEGADEVWADTHVRATPSRDS
jgi:asparagine synthetase B (glutamine-hydrolysing)